MKHLPIVFQSMERIPGKERRSKLLHTDSDLYVLLHQVKTLIAQNYAVGEDRMDLHIEITKNPDDLLLREKTQNLQNQQVDLGNAQNWGYLGRAFVLWAPEVDAYGKTHITVAYFGNHPKPSLDEIQELVLDFVKNQH